MRAKDLAPSVSAQSSNMAVILSNSNVRSVFSEKLMMKGSFLGGIGGTSSASYHPQATRQKIFDGLDVDGHDEDKQDGGKPP